MNESAIDESAYIPVPEEVPYQIPDLTTPDEAYPLPDIPDIPDITDIPEIPIDDEGAI